MASRITVIVDDEVLKKLRELQAKKLQASKENVSFSSVVNEILKNALK